MVENNRRRPVGSIDRSTVDPTPNVIDLLSALNDRQDDLRHYSERLTDAKVEGIKDIVDLQSKFIKTMADQRADYQKELSVAESKRIDAIRAVDVDAVAVGSQKSADQAQVLANQVAQSAETLRGLVASTAASVAQNLQQLSSSLSNRITTLEQGSYQAQGKQSFSDPAFVELLNEVKLLKQDRSESSGKTEGIRLSWGWIVGSFGVVVGIATIVGIVVSIFSKG